MNNIVYIRTSTDDQTPELQLRDLSKIVDINSAVVIKEQKSAWKNEFQREEFAKIIDLIKKREVSDLYAWDLDRIYRNRKKLVEFFQLCKLYGVKIHTYRQQWLEEMNQLPNPWGEIIRDLFINILGWLAEEESSKKSERIKNAIRKKNGRTVSYNGKRWGRKPLPKQTRDRIIELHEQGLSIRRIAEQIVTWKNGNSKKISKSVVHKIIHEYLAEKSASETNVRELNN